MRLPPESQPPARILSVGVAPAPASHGKPRAYDVQTVQFDIRGGCDRQRSSDQTTVGVAIGASTCFPFATGAFTAVHLFDVLEYIVDEASLLTEAARVLRPGGALVLRVPRAGPIAWLDSLNLYRYIVDTTRRARKPPETYAVGWRRHYYQRELERLLTDSNLECREITARGLGLAEPVNLALMLCCRWLLRRERLYQRVRPLYCRLARLDQHVAFGPFGYSFTVTAKRRDQPSAENPPTAPRPPATPPAPASKPARA